MYLESILAFVIVQLLNTLFPIVVPDILVGNTLNVQLLNVEVVPFFNLSVTSPKSVLLYSKELFIVKEFTFEKYSLGLSFNNLSENGEL